MKTLQKILLLMIFISSLMLATTITSWKTVYPTGNAAWIKVENKPNNAKDWIGIYKAGTNNDWGNVVAWEWAKEDSKEYPNWYMFPGIKDGKYEARFFLNNSFKVEKKVAFTIGNTAVKISTWKANYKSTENVWIKLSNKPGNTKDWIGIYKADTNNDWGNVVAWKWAKDDSQKYPNWYEFSGIKDGKYEARFFLNNSFRLEAKSGFSVGGGIVDYATYGPYESVLSKVSNDIFIYKPKKDGQFKQNAPVVIVGTGGFGSNVSGIENFIKFIVSKGYLVIGVSTGGDRNEEFTNILNALTDPDLNLYVDKTKIGLIGSSTGGGTIFYNLKRLKDAGYAENSFAISLDGTHAMGLTIDEVRNLHTTTLLFQFGGVDGLPYAGYKGYQDPRILMSIYNMLPENEKSLTYLDNNTHSYGYGSMVGKEDMLNPIGAMLAYKFANGGQDAKNVALNNNKYNEIDAAKFNIGEYRYGCEDDWDKHYNYCDVYNPQ